MDSGNPHSGDSWPPGLPPNSGPQPNGAPRSNGDFGELRPWSPEGFPPEEFPGEIPAPRRRSVRDRLAILRLPWFRFPRLRGPWLLGFHALLFLLTVLTSSFVGAGYQASFDANQPFLILNRELAYYEVLLSHPALLLNGLSYSITLLTILVAHEFGHYFACVYYRISATLPFFLPAPTFIGTFGAFIRIRQRIASRRELFDVGVAGPIAGFVFVIPALLIGVSLSKVIPGIGQQGDLVFGTPPLLQLIEMLLFPGVPVEDILLHPMARAGLVGLLATALNLLPVGQLDGGHIVYAFLPRAHRWISRGFVLLLLPLGFLWQGWFFWAAVLFLFGLKHPPVFDERDPGRARRRIALLALAIFLLCFTPVPVLS